MNPNTNTPVAVGEAWTPSDPFVPADGVNLVASPTREPFELGVNTPEITGIGWRRMVRRMLQARGFK